MVEESLSMLIYHENPVYWGGGINEKSAKCMCTIKATEVGMRGGSRIDPKEWAISRRAGVLEEKALKSAL